MAAWFDRLHVPLILLDSKAELRRTNPAAERLLPDGNGVCRGQLSRSAWLERVQSSLRAGYPAGETHGPIRIDPPLSSLTVNNDHEPYTLETFVTRGYDDSIGECFACILVAAPADVQTGHELARFFELSLDLFCIADLNGYFRTINSNFSARLGYSDSELTGRPFLAFIHPDDIAPTLVEMQRLNSGGTVVAFRNRYRDVHGVYHWFEWTARAVSGEGLVYASARDVTAQVEIESQLFLQEQRERAILDNTSAVIYVKDSAGRYQFVNREFSRLFHVSQEEVSGKTDFDLFPERMAEEFHRNDRLVLESGSPISIEEIAPHPDGPHNYLSIKFPLFDADGETVSVAGISTDISDRVWLQRTHEELRVAQQVQRRLFPTGSLELSGFDVHGKVLAASHLCGDYFDFVVRPNGRVVCCVADVSGHGLGPALEMVETRAMLRMLLKEDRPLSETVSVLNRLLFDDMPDSSFVTMFLLEIEVQERLVSYVGAGHDAILQRSDGAVTRLGGTGPVLGVWREATFAMSEPIAVSAGDLLLMCTDGIQETLSPEGELFGIDRICRALNHFRDQPAGTILNELFSMAHAFSRERLPRDDMTGILIKAL